MEARFLYCIDALAETKLMLKKINERLDALEKKEQKDYDSQFRAWVVARTRHDMYSDEQTTFADLWRSYRYWRESIEGISSKMTQAVFLKLIYDTWGKPNDGKNYKGLYVFNTNEDIEAYDAEKLA